MLSAVAVPPEHRAAFELVGQHCDIEERLQHSPPSARVRGIWFGVLTKQLEKRGLTKQYREIFPADDFSTLRFTWVGDFLIRAAVAGALVSGPEKLHEGMIEITRDNARSFASTLVGRSLFRLLSNDPQRVTQQAMASSRQTTNYGRWVPTFGDDGTIQVRYHQEYVWIESYMLGAALGTYDGLKRECVIETKLDDPFNGTHHIRFL